mmetsp:Transcript_9267/g.22744  ORF Transcript_9267/g.22744 Transcript_9267/m.22744 type:complete len:170 (+) Transcript_9267:209-718(+)
MMMMMSTTPFRKPLLFVAYAAALSLSLMLLGGPAQTVDAAVNNFMGAQTSELPLFATSTVDCDEMLTLHRWEGSCCSLNVTAGNGCVLNVMDGWCKVYGQIWTLDYNSTYDAKPCPNSEYTWQMLGMKTDPKAVVKDSGGGGGGVSSSRFSSGVFVVTTSLVAWVVGIF